MWNRIREWFELTKSESRGLAVLFMLIVLLWGTNFYIRYSLKRGTPINSKEFIEVLYSDPAEVEPNRAEKNQFKHIGYFDINEISFDDLVQSGLREKTARSIINYRNKGGKFFKPEDIYRIFTIDSAWVAYQLPYILVRSEKSNNNNLKKEELFLFNPNTADSLELIRLGFKPWQASNLLRYRQRGGKFYKREDLKRLYGIDSAFYSQIESFIDLPPLVYEQGTNELAGRTKKVNLNASDSLDLISLPGIGPVLAGRLIRYRNALGGYIDAEQLLEVYGLDSLRWSDLLPYIEIDTAAIRKININTAEESDLARHPYIRKGLAREIVAFRKNFRMFKSVKEISNLSLAKNKDLSKLYPYLSIEEN
ncbi:MAG: helix-hairpin-helix domain-containing protein [Thermaurantimonas sp.]